jgi:hypothetical protein
MKEPISFRGTIENCTAARFPVGILNLISNGERYAECPTSAIDYSDEELLIKDLLLCLGNDSQWGPLQVAREFYYLRGRTDVLALTSSAEVVAFEGKLTRWREALQQAFRNTCFAHCSYVLLPPRVALTACKHTLEFEKRRVGLCCIFRNKLEVLIDAPLLEPIQPWLTSLAISCFAEGGTGVKSA